MTTFSGTAEDGTEIVYTDGERHLWWLGLLGPSIMASAIPLYFMTGNNPLVTLIPALYLYAMTPLIDYFMGVDTHNPPEEVMGDMAADRYYKRHIYNLKFGPI